jgi:hypothetical protein
MGNRIWRDGGGKGRGGACGGRLIFKIIERIFTDKGSGGNDFKIINIICSHHSLVSTLV